MPKHKNSSSDRRRVRPPRRILAWLGRFLWWSFLSVAVSLALVAVIALLVYLNRVRIVNEALALLAAPYRVTVDEIHIRDLGRARVENLTLSPRDSDPGDPTIRVPEVDIRYDFGELRRTRQMKSLTLKNPRVVVNDELLERFRLEPSPDGTERPPVDLSSLAYFTDRVSVENGETIVDIGDVPKIQARWNFESGALTFDENDMLAQPVRFRIEDIFIGEEGNEGSVASLAVSVTMNRKLSRFDFNSIVVDRPELEVTPEWLPDLSKSPEVSEPGEPEVEPGAPLELYFNHIEITDGVAGLSGFDGRRGLPVIPDLSFATGFTLEGISYANNRWDSQGPLELALVDVVIGSETSQFLSADRFEAEITSLAQLVHDRSVEELTLESPSIILSDQTWQGLRQAPDGSTPEPPSESDSAELLFAVSRATVRDGRFLMQDFSPGGAEAPRIQSRIGAELEDLRITGGGFESEGEHAVQLQNFRLSAPGSAATAPLLAFERSELIARWPEFESSHRIERLSIREPRVRFTDEALGDWLEPEAEDTPAQADPSDRPVYKVARFDVTGGNLTADSSFAEGRVPKVKADFEIATREGPEVDPFSYRLTLNDMVLRNHPVALDPETDSPDPTLFPEGPAAEVATPVAEEEVFTVRQIEVDATAEELQRTRRIEKVKMSGAVLKVGEGLKAMVKPAEEPAPADDTATPPNPVPPADPPQAAAPSRTPALPTWTIEEIEVTQSEVRFEALIPQVQGLEFTIETRLTEVPLSPEGILAQNELQKVELAGIEIKDPYDSFITVATLPTIFVEFSLAGLASQEIERIDLIGPSLYVGQGLFWWIEYQRKFREQNEGASVGLPEGGPIESSPDWLIKTINANAGKIVIAPTGIPIGMVPFPFNATTNMSDGRIELKLNIPDEEYVYRFPDYKVNLYGLTGDIEFNVPVQQVNNNLVQTFSLDKAVWKEYEAQNLYLTVTFDAEGIYGKFGGDAYGGYAEGQFNFYLNEDGKWDAWIAGSRLDTGPLTEIIAPDNFTMDGEVSLKFVSTGVGKSVQETTAEFQTLEPGWFDVTKFDKILDELPPEWNNLKKSLVELGLIALKRFDYDQGSGSLYLLGRDGEFHLRFAGPYGTRELNLHLHDERNTTNLTSEP